MTPVEVVRTHFERPDAAALALSRRRDLTSNEVCRTFAGGVATHRYVYPLGGQASPVYVGVRCEAHDWRVVVAL